MSICRCHEIVGYCTKCYRAVAAERDELTHEVQSLRSLLETERERIGKLEKVKTEAMRISTLILLDGLPLVTTNLDIAIAASEEKEPTT